MASTIGIKLANREFYPVLEENSPARKRLVLTTVHDDQKSVQIDLYKSQLLIMTDALYIGSLVIEDISPKPRGAASVELLISSTPGGEIIADAVDLDARTGEHCRLDISLASLEGIDEVIVPDFELEDSPDDQPDPKRKKSPLSLLSFILGGVMVIVIWLGIWLFLSRRPPEPPAAFDSGNSGVEEPVPSRPSAAEALPSPALPPPAPPPTAPPSPAPLPPPPPEPVPRAEPPVITAPVRPPPAAPSRSRVRTGAPVTRYKIPAVIPAGGVPYKIQWGDTLWEISEAFYRNPWLYSRIARFNNIRNPNRIISGTTIRIPPRN
jgi:hypothetical protein